MEKATISQLKDGLSAYLKRVRAGQTVLVFDRNQAIARIERVDVDSRSEDRLIRLEKAGLIKAGKRTTTSRLLAGPVPKAKRSVVRTLVDERREGR